MIAKRTLSVYVGLAAVVLLASAAHPYGSHNSDIPFQWNYLRGKGVTEDTQSLIAALTNDETLVRATAAEALGVRKDTEAIPALRTLLSDPKKLVRADDDLAPGATPPLCPTNPDTVTITGTGPHVYNTAGTYYVTVQATDSSGTETASKQVKITVADAQLSDIEGPCLVCTGSSATFTVEVSPTEFADKVAWSSGGSPSTGSGLSSQECDPAVASASIYEQAAGILGAYVSECASLTNSSSFQQETEARAYAVMRTCIGDQMTVQCIQLSYVCPECNP